jgi:hypothetical protein
MFIVNRRTSALAVPISAFCFLLSALWTGCASTPKTTAPDLKAVPSIVIDAMCTKLRNEGMASGTATLLVVKTTQPIINGASLRSLAHSYGKDVDASAVAAAINSVVTRTPLDFRNTSCTWQPVEKLDPVAYAQLTVIQFSAPFQNPFTKNESGVLVRMSVGNHDAQWYWIPLAERQGLLGIGLVMAMDMHEG